MCACVSGGDASEGPWLGVRMIDLSLPRSRALGLDGGQGVAVIGVRAGSPALAAGVRPGDVLIAVDGRPVFRPNEVSAHVAASSAGRPLQLQLRRGRRQLVLRPVLAHRGPTVPRLIALEDVPARVLARELAPNRLARRWLARRLALRSAAQAMTGEPLGLSLAELDRLIEHGPGTVRIRRPEDGAVVRWRVFRIPNDGDRVPAGEMVPLSDAATY